MAMDITLKLTNIKGESVTDKHKEEIDVLAWSWGATNSTSSHVSTGGGTAKANVQDITITKYIDKATCDLARCCMISEHIPEGVLTVRKGGGKGGPVDYMTITLTDLVVSSIQTGGSGGEDRLTETISLNFAKIKMEYKMQDKAGGAKAGGTVTFDVATNKAA